MPKTSDEIRAAAESAIRLRQQATDAKAAADAARGADEDLNEASAQAERDASEAESTALTLSQSLQPDDKEAKKQKLLRKRGFIDKDLAALLGVDDEDELDRPVTHRDLQEMEATRARKSALQMAEAIADPLDRAAVVKSLQLVVPSSDPERDFQAAVAIANIDRNSKILEEVARRPAPRSTPTGAGAPPRREEEFVPTEHEKMFMTTMGLTKADILKARGK